MDTIERACHKAAGSIKDHNSQAFMEALVRIGAIGELNSEGILLPQWYHLPTLLALFVAALETNSGQGLLSKIETLATKAATASNNSRLPIEWQVKAVRILQEECWRAILDPNGEDSLIRAGEFLAIEKRFDAFADYFSEAIYYLTYRQQSEALEASVSELEAVRQEKARIEEDLRNTTIASVEALASAIDAKDQHTSHHSQRTAEIATVIAEGLHLPQNQVTEIRHSALLHDIGKIGIHDSVLTKAGLLNSAERDLIKLHPTIGASILAPVGVLKNVILGVLHHHERFDGEGYPSGLISDEISLEGRILCVSDALDAMTSDRSYRKALSLEEAVIELERKSGKQFDPDIVCVLIDNLDSVPSCSPAD